jgi:hypothetical protein
MVSSLIHYKDTHEFYEKHYQEIEDIRCQIKDDGITLFYLVFKNPSTFKFLLIFARIEIVVTTSVHP